MEQYALRATIKRKDKHDRTIEEDIDILSVSNARCGTIQCIDKDGKKAEETIIDQYSWTESGIIVQRVEVMMPGKSRMRTVSTRTKSFIITIILQHLKELSDHIVSKYKDVPEVRKDLDSLNPSIIIYVDVEPMMNPDNAFCGRLVRVSKYNSGPTVLEFERMSKDSNTTYNYRISTLEALIKGMNIVDGTTGSVGTYKFDLDRDSRSKAIKLIETTVGIEGEPPWDPVSEKTNKGCGTTVTQRWNEANTNLNEYNDWDGYFGHGTTYKAPEKEFFFKEFLGAKR